jgi:hypothetical protein
VLSYFNFFNKTSHASTILISFGDLDAQIHLYYGLLGGQFMHHFFGERYMSLLCFACVDSDF